MNLTNIEESVFDMCSSKNPEGGNNFIPPYLLDDGTACAHDREEERGKNYGRMMKTAVLKRVWESGNKVPRFQWDHNEI